MKHITKRLLALLLMLAMVFSLLPAMTFAAEDEMPQVDYITAEDDALVEADVLSDIDSYFDLSAKRDGELTLADYVAASDDLKALVQESDTYVEGSLVERGDGFFWQTTAGITCGYFPKDRYEADQRVATKAVNTSSLATWNYANATSKDVCLVAPMYSEDTTFTDQYVKEALSIAEALGGTAYGLIDTAATVTAIGQALEKCGVVIFDSHGNTDWGYFEGGSDGTGEADCVTQANTSYLCMSTGTGMTTADCAYVTGNFGTYPHAYKDSYGNYVADGTAFANHMNGNAPGSLLWMAICLGMSTEGFCTPLRNKGVSVVYGYSQSVTFYGDYLYEEYFWDKMIAGETVATAAAYMKSTAGCKWDPSYSYYSESSARREYVAFPVVVSDQDTYPGQRSSSSNGACSVQTVKSTYTLFKNYTISASTNNSNYGTVSVSGNVITASPKDGYYAKSYTVLSGTATVTQNGNIFTVDASSDCSIRINFAAKSSVTVSFSGVSGVSALTGYAGDPMTLPTVTAPEGYTFLGWTTASVNEAVTEKPEYFTVYTPTASITLYPLYSYAVAGGGSTEYVLTDIGEISATDSVVVTMTYTDGTVYALYNANGASSAPTATIVTVSGDKLASTPDSTILWNIGGDSSGYIFYPEGSTETWLYCISNNNGVRVGTNTANTFVIDASSGYLKHTGTGRYVGVYRTNPDWRCYTNTTGNTADQTLGFYVKGQGGTTYYTSVTGSACEHSNTTTATVDPTCTATGSTTVTCDDCGAVVSTTTIDALGHSYGNGVVTEPTCTEGGYTTYTCTVCGDSYQGDATAPNGHNYVDGACTVCGEAEPTTPSTEGYDGRYYIATIRTSGNYFYMSSDLGSSSTKRYQAVDSGLTTLPASIAEADVVANQVFVLELNADGTYSIYAEAVTGDNYLGWTSGNSGTLVAADSALALTVDVTDGIYNIHFTASDAERYLALNGTSGNNYFAWYKTSQKHDLVLIPVGGTTETPDPEPSCEHTNTTTATVDPTCTAAGSTTVTCDDCGAVVSTTPIDALGHSYDNGIVTEPTCTEGGYTTYTCTVCGDSYQGNATAPNGHNYVDGTCTVCGEAEPATPPTEGYEGRYYIASIRSSGNYFYMNSDLGTASNKRYQAVDSGLTILPASIAEADVVANQVFVLEMNADGTYKIYAESVSGSRYLGYTSGNSGTLVAADSALALTVDYADGLYNIHFAASDAERYLALNGTTGNNYFAWYKTGQKQDLVLIPVGGESTDPGTPDPEPSCEHTNTTLTGAVEATCTTDGYTGNTVCDDCGETIATGSTIEATGHSYVDGTCTNCGENEPAATDYTGRYYIAGIRSGDTNYHYIMGVMDGTRYDIEDSGQTALPAEISEPASDKVFVIEKNADGTYRIYAEGISDDYKYLGWTSSNTGSFVTADSALSLSIDALESGLVNIYFYSEGDAQNRYLSLNATATNTYAAWYKSGQTKDLALIPVTGEAPEHVHVPTYFAGQAATCEAEGVVEYWYCSDEACPNYGTCYSDAALTIVIADEDLIIDALGHNMVAGTVHAPTCTEEGYTEYACANGCGTTDIGDIIDALGHDMTYTDNGDGTHTYGCAYDCDIEDVVEDHVYIDGVCPCGAEEVVIPAEPTEVEIKISHTVSFDSDLKMNYRIKYTDIAAAVPNYTMDGAYLTVEKDRYPMGGGAKTVETVSLEPDLVSDDKRVLFSLPGIQSVEMGSELRAVLHFFDTDGNEYCTTVDAYSILAYAQLCFDFYDPTVDAYLFTMLIDCLNYGAAAQVHFDRRADEPVNAGLDAYQQYASTELSAELTDVRTYVDNDRTITAVTAMGFNVNFADKTEINAKLTIASGYTKADITSVKVLNEAGEVVDTLTQFTDLDDGRIQVTFTGVKSANMRDMYYFVAYVGDQVASQNVGYSIEAYAKSNIGSADAALAALVRNCIYYGDSAKVYFDSLLG